jgi:hypothetical protein
MILIIVSMRVFASKAKVVCIFVFETIPSGLKREFATSRGLGVKMGEVHDV